MRSVVEVLPLFAARCLSPLSQRYDDVDYLDYIKKYTVTFSIAEHYELKGCKHRVSAETDFIDIVDRLSQQQSTKEAGMGATYTG